MMQVDVDVWMLPKLNNLLTTEMEDEKTFMNAKQQKLICAEVPMKASTG